MSENTRAFLENINEYYMDEQHIDVSKEVNLVLSIANSLRGSFEAEKYKDVIIPMVIIRRFECALEETKEKLVNYYEKNPNKPAQFYEKETGYPFYNTSRYSLKKLLDDSDNIESNFNSYIDAFSENVKEILNNLDIGIALFDAEGNYLFVNTELVNWRNIPMLEFLKMNVHDFLNILDVCVFDLVKKKNHRVSRLQYYKNKDHVDSKRRLRVVTGTPIFDENGKIKYVIMALQDVESFENLYQALLRQNQIGRAHV